MMQQINNILNSMNQLSEDSSELVDLVRMVGYVLEVQTLEPGTAEEIRLASEFKLIFVRDCLKRALK